jgi:hypothetical protein
MWPVVASLGSRAAGMAFARAAMGGAGAVMGAAGARAFVHHVGKRYGSYGGRDGHQIGYNKGGYRRRSY